MFRLVSGEIARQNKITEQILAQFIQKRFFPHLSPPSPPTRDQSSDQEDPDTLETVESEHIPNVYDEDKDDDFRIEGGPHFYKLFLTTSTSV